MIFEKCVNNVKGKKFNFVLPRYGLTRDDSVITQNDSYGVKELFQRHAAGNAITCQEWKDIGNGARDFSEISPLDRLDGDLTDIDTIQSYIEDYKGRKTKHEEYVKQLKAQQHGNITQQSTE